MLTDIGSCSRPVAFAWRCIAAIAEATFGDVTSPACTATMAGAGWPGNAASIRS
jgi:hypothetical protein